MPRPRKGRRVCCMPGSRSFGPLDGGISERRSIVMTVDEFEAIRLIDLEGLTQEECAQQMAVARTTAQAIYNSARVKLAECLVKGVELSIGGGDYVLCDGESCGCGRGHCHKRRCHPEEEESGSKVLGNKELGNKESGNKEAGNKEPGDKESGDKESGDEENE